jgi:hypothetical protein
MSPILNLSGNRWQDKRATWNSRGNPGEAGSRPKALYMTYFVPWDWIISISSYRSEFNAWVNVEVFRDSILLITGCCFVIGENPPVARASGEDPPHSTES